VVLRDLLDAACTSLDVWLVVSGEGYAMRHTHAQQVPQRLDEVKS
jgi:hypothetical protein